MSAIIARVLQKWCKSLFPNQLILCTKASWNLIVIFYCLHRVSSQQSQSERLELPLLSSEGRMQRAYSHEGDIPIVLQPLTNTLTSPHTGGKTESTAIS